MAVTFWFCGSSMVEAEQRIHVHTHVYIDIFLCTLSKNTFLNGSFYFEYVCNDDGCTVAKGKGLEVSRGRGGKN